MSRHLTELSAFCRRILGEGDLETKLEAPGEALTRDFPPLVAKEWGDPPPARPTRQPRLALRDGTEKLPALRALADPVQRRRCLERSYHSCRVREDAKKRQPRPETPAALQGTRMSVAYVIFLLLIWLDPKEWTGNWLDCS